MRKLYRPYYPREAAARGLLEVSLRWWLRKTLAPVLPKKAVWEQQRRQVFIIVNTVDTSF